MDEFWLFPLIYAVILVRLFRGRVVHQVKLATANMVLSRDKEAFGNEAFLHCSSGLKYLEQTKATREKTVRALAGQFYCV